MPERVLVTGATGFVGSHIAEALVGAGYRVRCGVRKAARWASGLDAELVPLDLSRPGDLPRAVRGADVVIHAGGITRARHEEGYRRINAEGTRVLAEAASAAGVRRFVLISSLAARGPDGAAGPASPYGLSKLEAEEIVRSFEGRMEVCALRPAAVYGPRDTDLLPLFRTASRG
ncbi:MAG: NAD(P)-dependent oxidoreductase, partial [Actinomycetota bacterium]